MKIEFESNGDFDGIDGMFYPAFKMWHPSEGCISCAAIYDGGDMCSPFFSTKGKDDARVVLVANFPCATAEEAEVIADENNPDW